MADAEDFQYSLSFRIKFWFAAAIIAFGISILFNRVLALIFLLVIAYIYNFSPLLFSFLKSKIKNTVLERYVLIPSSALLKKTINNIKLILTIPWVLLFIYLGYTSYDVSGDDAMGSAMLHIAITFPLCVPFIFIVKVLNIVPPSGSSEGLIRHLTFEVFFFVIGYLQWFILLPWIINKGIKSLNKKG